MSNWVLPSVITREKGYTKDQMRGKRDRKVWREGIEWCMMDGRVHYDLEAISQWQDTQASVLIKLDESKSTTKSTASGTMKPSNSTTTRLIAVQPLR